MSSVNIVVACTTSGGIGYDGKIPWHLPDDLKHFKDLTHGTICIMGRTTFESLGMPDGLPGRLNIVISKSLCSNEFNSEGRKIRAYDFDHAIQIAESYNDYYSVDKDISIIGGERVYKEALKKDLVDNVYLTKVYRTPQCDTFFPISDIIYAPNVWELKHISYVSCQTIRNISHAYETYRNIRRD